MERLKEMEKPRIGLYSAGLATYWKQFSGLYDCLMEYNAFIEKKLSVFGEIYNYGMVDIEEKGREAGEYFNEWKYLYSYSFCRESSRIYE